jgi:hypothetical protein
MAGWFPLLSMGHNGFSFIENILHFWSGRSRKKKAGIKEN